MAQHNRPRGPSSAPSAQNNDKNAVASASAAEERGSAPGAVDADSDGKLTKADGASAFVEDRPEMTGAGASAAGAKPGVPESVTAGPAPEAMAELYRAEQADLHKELTDISRLRDQLRQREEQIYLQLDELNALLSEVAPPATTTEAIQAYIASAQAARVARFRRREELITNGAAPGEINKPRAPIDEAYTRRGRRGADRPEYPQLST